MLPILAVEPAWWTFLHLIGVFGFLIAHGVSIAVAFRLRKERDRERIRSLLQLSGQTVVAMYVSLALLTAAGIIAAIELGWWQNAEWPRISLGVLIVAVLAMGGIARPYYKGIKEACEIRPSGVPRVSDEDLAARLTGWQPWAITAIGFASLLGILWMMVFKKPI